MKIQKIYNKYKIMPQLQLHMLRVAGVSEIICNSFQKEINKDSIITSCLLHDIGTIAHPKFQVDLIPDHVQPEGKKYWLGVQSDFIKKYGNDDHKATAKISRELSVPKKVIQLIESFGFGNTPNIYKSKSFELKISTYSDQRIALEGVTTLQKRLEEAKDRYLNKKKGKYTKEQFQKYIPMWEQIEQQIFYHTKISPGDITDRKVMRLISKLKNYEIETG